MKGFIEIDYWESSWYSTSLISKEGTLLIKFVLNWDHIIDPEEVKLHPDIFSFDPGKVNPNKEYKGYKYLCVDPYNLNHQPYKVIANSTSIPIPYGAAVLSKAGVSQSFIERNILTISSYRWPVDKDKGKYDSLDYWWDKYYEIHKV